MDSELIVKQMSGEYRVKDAALKKQHAAVREILTSFGTVCFVHVPRAENKEADRLVNEAIDGGV
jgi:ribonuclease HI